MPAEAQMGEQACGPPAEEPFRGIRGYPTRLFQAS